MGKNTGVCQRRKRYLDVEPKYDIWRCPHCFRVYVFDKAQLMMQYKLEHDYRHTKSQNY